MTVLTSFTQVRSTYIMKCAIQQSSERTKPKNSNMIKSSEPWISKPTRKRVKRERESRCLTLQVLKTIKVYLRCST